MFSLIVFGRSSLKTDELYLILVFHSKPPGDPLGDLSMVWSTALRAKSIMATTFHMDTQGGGPGKNILKEGEEI